MALVRRQRVRRVLFMAVCLALLWVPCPSGYAFSGRDDLKAAFLYNFAKFVEWPESVLPNEAEIFRICIIGKDGLVQAAQPMLRDKQVHGRRVEIRAVQDSEENQGCQVLYIDGGGDHFSEAMIRRLTAWPVLTIGDSAQFLQGGGVIRLVEVDGKMRFEVSLQAATRAQLKISSKLLKLGRVVEIP